MKKVTTLVAAAALLAMAAAVSAQDIIADRTYDLTKITTPPTLDGDRFSSADEWAGATQTECSVSRVLEEGAAYGWRDQENQWSEVSGNQLGQSEGESAAIARTDDDASCQIWQAWDDDAFYYVAEVRDNIRDVVGGGANSNYWWERDSISLYLDTQNERTSSDANGYYSNLNIINYIAAPQNSSSVTVTVENTVQNARAATQDPDIIEGFDYGFTDREDEFGGETDYCIEGSMAWEAFLRLGNLPAVPGTGTVFSYSWILLDADDNEGFGGQIVCDGYTAESNSYALWVLSDTPAGPPSTAVEANSWGRIKASF